MMNTYTKSNGLQVFSESKGRLKRFIPLIILPENGEKRHCGKACPDMRGVKWESFDQKNVP